MKHSRRGFVRNVGLGVGGLLFAPLLRSVRAAEARPVRFVIFLEGNGTEPAAYLHKRGTRAAAGITEENKTETLKAILAAGATGIINNARDYRHSTTLITVDAKLGDARVLESLRTDGARSSLESKAALVMGLSSRVTGGSHTTFQGALGARKSSGSIPTGPTIDHILGGYEAVRRSAPFDVVRVGSSGSNVLYDSCAIASRKPAAISCNPTQTFNMLFGSVATGAGAARFTSSGQLLDFARAEARAAIATFSGGSLERAKVEAYVTSLEDMVTRRQTIIAMEDELRAAKPAEPDSTAAYTSSDARVRLGVQVDTAAAAMIGGLTNVVVVSCGSGGAWSETFANLDLTYPENSTGGKLIGHDLRHSAGGTSLGSTAREVLHEMTQVRISEMARMARLLEAVQEPNAEGTMLDYTVFLYMSDNGEMHHSNAEEWPSLLIGGQRLGLATDGRSIVFPKVGGANHRQMSNLFNTLGHVAGTDLNDFGGEGNGRVAEGPLSELWAPV